MFIIIPKQPLTENELTVLKSKSIEEARALHREIQRRRMLTSFQEAKFRRLRRIKSKKYHRILKKEKLKKTVEEFDAIVDGGAEGAEEKLAELDRLRALERASLKHHITGKWSKYNKIRAKYDDSARDELNQQMAINAELMKKRSLAVLDEFDGDDQDDDDGEIDFGGQGLRVAEDSELSVPNNYNPWISSAKTKKAKVVSVLFDTESVIGNCFCFYFQNPILIESKVPSMKDDNSVERFFAKRVQDRLDRAAKTERDEALMADSIDEKNIDEGSGFGPPSSEHNVSIIAKAKMLTTTIEPVDEDSSDDDEDNDDVKNDQINSRKNVNLNLNSLIVDLDDIRKKPSKVVDNSIEPDDQNDFDGDDHVMGEFDFHGTDMQRYLREAFIDDDVVQDFLKEKREQVDAEKETKAQVYLPGWGSWAGSGIKESRRKKQRVTKRVVKQSKRLDQKIANAIILTAGEELGSKFKVC